MLFYWVVFPPIAAAIGWFTNFVAVRMLFRPHRPIRFLGVSLQGMLPRRKAEFARNIGQTVAAHLVAADDVQRALQSPEAHRQIRSMLETRVDDFFENKLAAKVPMVGMFLKGETAQTIKTALVDELQLALDKESGSLMELLEEHMKLDEIVERKILDFDLHQLEELVLRVARKELRWIEWLGAVLGFIVGLVQAAILTLRAQG